MLKKLGAFALIIALAAGLTACGEGKAPVDVETPESPAGTEQTAGTTDVERGDYIDGTYIGNMPDYDELGWQEIAVVTITDGRIAKILWDAQNKDSAQPNKLQQSLDGQYVIEDNAKGEWHEQTAALCDYIVQTQDPDSVVVDANGRTDAVVGCTIAVDGFMEALQNALAQAK